MSIFVILRKCHLLENRIDSVRKDLKSIRYRFTARFGRSSSLCWLSWCLLKSDSISFNPNGSWRWFAESLEVYSTSLSFRFKRLDHKPKGMLWPCNSITLRCLEWNVYGNEDGIIFQPRASITWWVNLWLSIEFSFVSSLWPPRASSREDAVRLKIMQVSPHRESHRNLPHSPPLHFCYGVGSSNIAHGVQFISLINHIMWL